MIFPYRELFLDNGIQFMEHGEHCAIGNVVINCPFCNAYGKPDHGYHMGISLSGKGWGCWRTGDHRGKSPARLIETLLGISAYDARKMAAEYTGTKLDNFTRVLEPFDPVAVMQEEVREDLLWPEGFVVPSFDLKWTLPHLNYMISRGFGGREVESVCAYYDIRATRNEFFSNRVLVALHSEKKLIGWAGRSIEAHPYLRWKILSARENKSPWRATDSNNNHVGGEQYLFDGGEALILTEGQFDYIKLDWYGKEVGVRATCLFNKTLSREQEDLLYYIIPLFKRVYVMLDAGTGYEAQTMAMRFKNLTVLDVPFSRKDAGELTRLEAIRFTRNLGKTQN